MAATLDYSPIVSCESMALVLSRGAERTSSARDRFAIPTSLRCGPQMKEILRHSTRSCGVVVWGLVSVNVKLVNDIQRRQRDNAACVVDRDGDSGTRKIDAFSCRLSGGAATLEQLTNSQKIVVSGSCLLRRVTQSPLPFSGSRKHA